MANRAYRRRGGVATLLLAAAAGAAAQEEGVGERRPSADAPAEAAAPATATELFAAGGRAFEAGDYRVALARFQGALRAGGDGPAVRYNIAVCHYRLGDYAEAEDAFRELARRFPDLSDLADYNLGLALTRLGRLDDARSAFERVLDADDESVATLAAAMLERLPGAPAEPRTPWVRLADLRLGYDDNVALIDAASLPAERSTDSAFTELLVYAGGPVSTGQRWRVDATAYLVRYLDANEFDQDVVSASARYGGRVGAWRVAAGPEVGLTTLDGDAFERYLGAVVDLRRELASLGAVLGASLTHAEVSAADARFDYVEGGSDRARVMLDKALGSGRLVLDYRHERNDRDGPGVSADRNRYSVRYGRSLPADWTGEIVYEYRISDYERLAVPRTERRHQIGFDAMHRTSSAWRFHAQYRYEDNGSSDPVYSYERYRVSIGVSRLF